MIEDSYVIAFGNGSSSSVFSDKFVCSVFSDKFVCSVQLIIVYAC